MGNYSCLKFGDGEDKTEIKGGNHEALVNTALSASKGAHP